MAEKVARPRVEFNGKQIEQQLESLEQKARDLRKELKAAVKLDDPKIARKLKSELNAVEKETRQLKREVISVDNVLRDLNGTNFSTLKKAFIQQSKLVRNLRKDSKDYHLEVQKLKTLKGAMAGFNNDLMAQQSLFKRAANGFNNYFGIITAGIASLSGIGLTIRKAVDLANVREEVVDDLQALTGLSNTVVAELEKTAVKTATTIDESGVRIKQSADDIVSAYKLVGSQRAELLKDSEALHAVTKDAIILSEAAKGELEPSARALTNTLNQFQESADQSRRIINILAAGSQAGAADISYLSRAIEKTGTSANLMGMSIEQTIGTIEAIAPFYAEASMAGNSFDKVLLKLKAQQIGYKSGVFDLNDAIDELRKKYQSGTTSVDIFGAEHAKLGELLVQNQGEINRYTDAVTGTNKAIEQANINTGNNAAALAQAKNKSKEYAIELGKRLQPAMRALHISGTHMLKFLMAIVDFFTKYGKQVLIVTAAITGYTVAIRLAAYWNRLNTQALYAQNLATKAFALAKGILTGKIKMATAAQKAWNFVQKLNPIGLVTSLILGAGTALLAYRKKTDKAKDSQSEFNDELERTEDLMGRAQYDEFLKQIGFISQELVTLADGSKSLVPVINENIDVIQKFSESLKTLRESELENYKRFFEEELVTLQRSAATETNAITAEITKQKIEEYKQALKLVTAEIKKYEDLRKKINEESNGEIKTNEEDLQKALYELRKQYGLVKQGELYAREVDAFINNKATKLLTEEEYQKALLAIREKYFPKADKFSTFEDDEDPVEESPEVLRAMADARYTDEIYKNSLDYQYDLLQQQWKKGEIGWTEYRDKLKELDDYYFMEQAEKLITGFDLAATLATGALEQDRVNLDIRKERELANAGDSAQKRAEIELKYRKKQKELALKQAWIDLALAELKAIASAPPPANIPAIIAATAAGMFSISKIKNQEYLTGGYTGFDGNTTDIAGFVHKKEFVANATATANPTVKPVLDIINLAQQNGTIKTIDLPAAIYSLNATRGYVSGGYTSTSTASNPETRQMSINTEGFEKAAMYIYKAAEIFAEKKLIITQEAIKKITEAGAEYEIQKTAGSR